MILSEGFAVFRCKHGNHASQRLYSLARTILLAPGSDHGRAENVEHRRVGR
jgi:hypothetical protein